MLVPNSKEHPTRFRLLRRAPIERGSEPEVVSYTNRKRVTYYLHEVVCRDGRRRYVCRQTLGEGAVTKMPVGFEFTETLGGRVAFRRKFHGGSRIPMEDLELVRTVLSWHPRLVNCIADRCMDRIMFYEPDPEPDPEEKEARRRGYTLANKYAEHPHVRAAMVFQLCEPDSAGDDRIYEARGPRSPYQFAHWPVIDRGRLLDLAVRHVPRLDLGEAIH